MTKPSYASLIDNCIVSRAMIRDANRRVNESTLFVRDILVFLFLCTTEIHRSEQQFGSGYSSRRVSSAGISSLIFMNLKHAITPEKRHRCIMRVCATECARSLLSYLPPSSLSFATCAYVLMQIFSTTNLEDLCARFYSQSYFLNILKI